MPTAQRRLHAALVCVLLSLLPALTYVPYSTGVRIGGALFMALVYGALWLASRRAPRVVALLLVLDASLGLRVWHGVAHTLVGLLSAADMILALSVLFGPRTREPKPVG